MEKETQEYSKIQWFIMVIFIPVVFAIILFSVILSFMGVDVVGEGKQIASKVPFLSEYIKTDEQLSEEEKQANIKELTAQVETHKTEIKKLEEQLVKKQDEIQSLLAEIDMLIAQLEEAQTAQLEITTNYKQLAKLYESMSASKAADIIVELPISEAVAQLSFIKLDFRSAIFAKMEPEQAAQFIALLSEKQQ